MKNKFKFILQKSIRMTFIFILTLLIKFSNGQGCCPDNFYLQIGNCIVDYDGNIASTCSTTVCADQNCNVPITICVYGSPCIFNINFQINSIDKSDPSNWIATSVIPLINQTSIPLPPNGAPYCFTYNVPMAAITGKFITVKAVFATNGAVPCPEDMIDTQKWIFADVNCAPEHCIDSQGGGGNN